MKVIFFGTSSFSVAILEHLLQSPYQIIAVVTRVDKPQGRSLELKPPPVKEWVQVHAPQIPLYQPSKASAEEFVAFLRSLAPDLFVVASYGEIVKTSLLNAAPLGAINVHTSLLPKWRGAAPIQRSLMAGEQVTGVTIMKMALELDAGDILDQTKVEVLPEMTYGELEQALAVASKEPLLQVLSQMEHRTLQATPQDPSKVTFAPKILPQDRVIDWSRTADEIHNQIRALSPEPGAWTSIEVGGQTKKMKIKRSRVAAAPATLTAKEWIVSCGKGHLSLLEVQLEGKKTLSIGEFLRGVHGPIQLIQS